MREQHIFINTRHESEGAGRHALVIGGSLAGLLAARVLSEHFERVTVIERDRYPVGPAPRKGVPQARHVHGLMRRGQLILERLFPGLREELIEAGALELDMARDAAWLNPAGWGVRFDSGLKILSFTRPLLDWHVRRRLSAHGRVRFLEGAEVTRLLPGAGRSIAGAWVRFRAMEGGAEARGEWLAAIDADLVVDAGGRASRAPVWLEDLGRARPQETVINSFSGYASRLYRLPPEAAGRDWKCAFLQAAPPEHTRSALVFPVEWDRWLVSLIGRARDYPPTDDAGFTEYLRSLRSPLIYEAVKDAEPVSPIYSHHASENRLRHFERLTDMPDNFLVTGDAACAFNPVYGQGMTIAAIGAETLSATLVEQSRRRPDGNLEGLSDRFQRRLARVNAAPWLLATGEDFRYRETVGGQPSAATRLMHRYMDGVVRLTTTDARVRQTLMEVFHMLRTPRALFRPRILFRVLGQKASARGADTPEGRQRVARARETSGATL